MQRRPYPRSGSVGYLAILAYVLLTAVSVLYWQRPLWLPLTYAAMSLLSLLVYAQDKFAAQGGGWRTPESTLLLLALLGGWPGALLAQQWLRHKSRKWSFRFKLWCAVVLNIALFIAAATPVTSWLRA